MPHGGRTMDELYAAGISDPLLLDHAEMDEIEGMVAADLPSFGDDNLINPTGPDDEGGNEDGNLTDPPPGGDPDGVPGDGPINTTEDATQTTETDVTLTGLDQQQSEEIINRIERVYFDVQTPEDFLDDFFTAFSGFAVSMASGGLGDADFTQMLDPGSGFMQQMMNEFIGEQARRAAAGEDIFEVVGVEGDPEFLGSREGDVSTTVARRLTRQQASEQLRRDGITVTEESIDQTIEDDYQEQLRNSTVNQSQETQTDRDTVTIEDSSSEFTEQEDVFSRPRIDQVYKFSPANFLASKYGNIQDAEGNNISFDEMTEEQKSTSIGRLSTQIRAAAPRNRPGGGGPTLTSVSARRS